MSHEYTLLPQEEEEFPLLVIEPLFPEIEINLEINKKPEPLREYGFFYVPDEPDYLRYEFDGIQFEGVQYTWDEFDYRLDVEYKAPIPESSAIGSIMGVLVLIFVLYKIINKKGSSNMKCAICKTKDGIINFFNKLYNKLSGGK